MNESPDKKPPQDLLDWLGISNAPNWWVARLLGRTMGAALVLLFALALYATFAVLVRAIFGGEVSLGVGGLIAAILGAPFLIWGTVLKHQTVRYQKEGHMTDRIAKAVEQLGVEKTVKKDGTEDTVPNLEVRMGAILSLERIAQDSTIHDKGRDHVMVMQILCEYIRENSNARTPQDHPYGEWEPLEDDATEEERATHEALRKARLDPRYALTRQWAQTLPKPRADVQLALKVIGRRSARQRLVEAAWPNPPDAATRWPFDPDFQRLPDKPGETALTLAQIEAFKAGLAAWKQTCADYRGYRLDLRGANLQGADLAAGQPDGSDAVFSGARLYEARMEGARLFRARMEGASLDGARMEGASLIMARVEGARLEGARMEGASLYEAGMEGARLDGARMEGASLYWAWMEGASFDGARLEAASFYRARMEGASLDEARMEGASLYRARMEGASLTEARMEGANLHGARMEGASLHGARMEGAVLRDTNLSGATGLTPEHLATSFGDGSVVLPEGLEPPAHWPKHRLSPRDFNTERDRWRASPSTYTPPSPP